MFILKIGGSVITDKTKPQSFKQKIMDNLAKEIKKANKEIILVHGAGSFGHILAKQYNLNEGYSRQDQIKGFSLTHEKVQLLNSLVLKSLHNNSIHAVSISPHSILKLNNHKLEQIDCKIFKEYLEKNFTPVTFGDVVLDKKLGFSICSGDLLASALAKHFTPEKVIFVLDEDGLYESNPKINKDADFIPSATIGDLEKLRTSADEHVDVTGGMAGKLQTIKNIANIGVDTVLLNGNKPNRLYKVLIGEDTRSTIIYGGKK
ncbi:MAG: isopentenyl phosphate kinase family protein [Thermoplasmatales archaeon]|nr:MAG: isopentenyl phosphate kinase family protein [Thermoplasmatales archaeon]